VAGVGTRDQEGWPAGVVLTAGEAGRHDALVPLLELAVPLWISHWRGSTPFTRTSRAAYCGEVVGEHGDVLMFRSRPVPARTLEGGIEMEAIPGTGEVFDRLAEGIALAAYQPGGIDLFGHHWEVPG
jgi:hypothetical protein